MVPRLLSSLGLALGLALAAPAWADDVPSTPLPSPPASAGAAKPTRPFIVRPVVVGLIAGLFVIVAAAASMDEKKKKRSG